MEVEGCFHCVGAGNANALTLHVPRSWFDTRIILVGIRADDVFTMFAA